MLKLIRILLSITTFYDYEIWQMDVKTTFLNDNLEKSIYMAQLEGFEHGQEQKVCYLTDIKKWLATQLQMKDLEDAQLDICYLVGMIGRYQSNPKRDHWITVKNILKYLRRTKDYMLMYVFTLNGGAVVLRSVKQTRIVDSTMEAEYIAVCEATKEAVWLRKFLTNLEVVPNMHLPITLYCDNSSVVANSRKLRSHKRKKIIKHKYHLMRKIVHRSDVVVTQMSSEQKIVDPITKAFTTKVFEGHLQSLGLRCLKTRISRRLIEHVP
ncbi:retrovirus-related pol polyprotein from transposon tnt 1-94 [Cucumis melo var. makuwa]|uniref:Retrovirus-related pol polyprotein from transposon tnt 1-94 n=1 Tax=Cucumis melo var. makuwa TaxID=1194695 RepID=A0A5D3DZS8_CUCMM|nr:retrovirus-related pol polyprotein from transposon tnt 1-94 [Cucumis melo var. makuwa]